MAWHDSHIRLVLLLRCFFFFPFFIILLYDDVFSLVKQIKLFLCCIFLLLFVNWCCWAVVMLLLPLLLLVLLCLRRSQVRIAITASRLTIPSPDDNFHLPQYPKAQRSWNSKNMNVSHMPTFSELPCKL